MSKHYVFSTLSNRQRYTNYDHPAKGGQPVPVEHVVIEGGANVANKNLVTPKGVVTIVSDEQYEILKRNFVFNQHVKGGHIVVRDRNIDVDVAVSKDMEKKDGSAPITPDSLKDLAIAAKPMEGTMTSNKMRGMAG